MDAPSPSFIHFGSRGDRGIPAVQNRLMDSERVQKEVAEALAAHAELVFDFDGDGSVTDDDVELLRRLIANELASRRPEQMDAPTLAVAPQELEGRWKLLGLLGRGGQAATYLARDGRSGAYVAVKELDLGRIDDWKSIELFEREAQALERLDHPGVPSYVAHFSREVDGRVRFYLVQQYVRGLDLGEELANGGPLNERAAEKVRDEVFAILEYLHSFNPPIVHRDVKPSNLIRDTNGKIVLVDFGAVQSAHAKTMGGSTVVGTSGYMPMEQYMGRATPASDLYALGATLVHLMTGVSPTDLPVEENRLRFDGRLKVTAPFANGLHQLLEPAVEKRPATVAAARAAFETALLAPSPPKAPKAKRRSPLLPVAAAFLLGGLAVAFAYRESQTPDNFVEIENLYPAPPADAKKVLFVGNSHTYWWDQPKLVARMVPDGQPKLWFDVWAWPGADVRFHVENDIEGALRSDDWQAVVLQPQSVEPAASQEDFGANLARFEKLVPKPMRSIVWVPWARDPRHDIYSIYKRPWSGGSFEELTRRLETGVRSWAGTSEICPLGTAILRVRTEIPEAPVLDEKDGNKVTHVGAYLNGLMLYSCIYRRDPAEVTFVPDGLTPESAAKLRKIASDTARDYDVFPGERR